MPDPIGDAVADALTRYLNAGVAAPESFDDIAAVFGPTPRAQNPAMAIELAATRDKHSPAYKAALRRVQRWRTTGTQRRRPSREALDRVRGAARRRLVVDRVSEVRRNGLSMRLGARIRVSKAFRFHWMPADAAGRPRFQHIAGEDLRSTLDAWLAGDMDEAAGQLLRAFFAAYWAGDEEPAEVGEIEAVQLR